MKRTRPVLVVVLLLAGLFGYRWYQHTYPYGRRHCCDKILYQALWNYAHEHDGTFPAGEATSEASLSLIHTQDPGHYAEQLCGRNGSPSVALDKLSRGELLGPETCGWHYVDGLRTESNPELALFWDKEGLGHNCERLDGHEVVFVGGDMKYIPNADWEAFLKEQSKLLAQEKEKAKGRPQASRHAN